MATVVNLADKPLKPIPRPRSEGPYDGRNADLIRALRPRFKPDADQQALTLEAYHAGWGLDEIGQAIEALKEERGALP